MEKNYEDYLGDGTKQLMEFLADPDIEEGEKEAVVAAFSGELSENIGDVKQLEDGEQLIYLASIKYLDSAISDLMAKVDGENPEYDRAFTLIKRARIIMEKFKKHGWKLPNINNSDLDKAEEIFRKRQEMASIENKITQEDKSITELIKTAELDRSVSACDAAAKLLDDLRNDLAFAKQKKIIIPPINNKDFKKINKQLVELRKVAEQKEELHKRIADLDTTIGSLVSLDETTEEQWKEVVKACKEMKALLTECLQKKWPMPSISHSNPDEIANKYEHYLAMLNLDRILSSDRELLNTGKQYKKFYANCAQQAQNIEVCRNNNWNVPNLKITNPMKESDSAQSEKKQKDKKKNLKRNLVLAVVFVIALIALSLMGIHKYREGKVQIPFDSSYAPGASVDLICEQLEEAGFTNIQKKEDTAGWLDSGEVISVSVDNSNDYKQGVYKKPEVSVVITYSSLGRIYATDLLKDWENTNYATIINTLKEAGFTNIDTKEVDTTNKEQDTLVAKVSLNGTNYTNDYCYIPKDAPITISYYALKVGIGNDSSEFIGQNYETVVKNLKDSGFTNVQTTKITTGWAKGNAVVGVTINNMDNYDSSQTFDPDVKIVVKYSSDDRIDAAAALDKWNTKNFETIQKALKNKGFTNITLVEKSTEEKSQNQLVSTVSINGEEYKSGDCFVQQSAKIVIEYYTLKLTIGESASSLTSNTEGKYETVVALLKDKGFTNIKLYRKNDLIKGWLTKEGSIDSISIDGNDDFSDTDIFDYDAEIVIKVHTFKKSGCEDITEVEE